MSLLLKKLFFLTIILCPLFVFIGLAQAADIVNFTPQVSIPGSEFQSQQEILIKNDTSLICDYVVAIYKYAIAIVGILAVLAVAIGGVMWIMAAGNSGRIGEGKEWIMSGFLGLLLALGSFMILATINKDLVTCKMTPIENLAKINATPKTLSVIDTADDKDYVQSFGCCTLPDKSLKLTTKKSCVNGQGQWQADSFVANNQCVKGNNCCQGDDTGFWASQLPSFIILVPTNSVDENTCEASASLSSHKTIYWDLIENPCSTVGLSVDKR